MSRLLCVALAVPAPLGPTLDRVRALLHPDRQHMTAHITLTPPTRIDDADVPAVVEAITAACSALPAVHVSLDGARTFTGRSRTVYLEVQAGAEAVTRIQAALTFGPFVAEGRPFHPHVTIANRCAPVVLAAAARAFAGFRAEFDVDAVTVFEHGTDGWWPIAVAPLGALGQRGS